MLVQHTFHNSVDCRARSASWTSKIAMFLSVASCFCNTFSCNTQPKSIRIKHLASPSSTVLQTSEHHRKTRHCTPLHTKGSRPGSESLPHCSSFAEFCLLDLMSEIPGPRSWSPPDPASSASHHFCSQLCPAAEKRKQNFLSTCRNAITPLQCCFRTCLDAACRQKTAYQKHKYTER